MSLHSIGRKTLPRLPSPRTALRKIHSPFQSISRTNAIPAEMEKRLPLPVIEADIADFPSVTEETSPTVATLMTLLHQTGENWCQLQESIALGNHNETIESILVHHITSLDLLLKQCPDIIEQDLLINRLKSKIETVARSLASDSYKTQNPPTQCSGSSQELVHYLRTENFHRTIANFEDILIGRYLPKKIRASAGKLMKMKEREFRQSIAWSWKLGPKDLNQEEGKMSVGYYNLIWLPNYIPTERVGIHKATGT